MGIWEGKIMELAKNGWNQKKKIRIRKKKEFVKKIVELAKKWRNLVEFWD